MVENKKLFYGVLVIVLFVIGGIGLFMLKQPSNTQGVYPSIIQGDPFGAPPKGISPNCGPEVRYNFDVSINSKDDFVDFIKNNKIDPRVRLDNFKDEPQGEVNWDKVLGSIKTDKIGSRMVYSLDYYPIECSGYTLKITNDGHVSVYGCCGK